MTLSDLLALAENAALPNPTYGDMLDFRADAQPSVVAALVRCVMWADMARTNTDYRNARAELDRVLEKP